MADLLPAREQLFCGTWYDCTAPRCRTSVLLTSPGLQRQLAEQQGATMQPEQMGFDMPTAKRTSEARTHVHFVQVDDPDVYATADGLAWWLQFLDDNSDRVKRLRSGPGGGVVQVACEDRTAALELRNTMIGRGLNERHVTAKRRLRGGR